MYDVIIVGGRVAGSSVARLLARRGARVLLVDRARFPSDTFNGHYIQAAGARYLERWGLLDRVLTPNATPVKRHRAHFGPIDIEGTFEWADGDSGVAVAPRRHRLDHELLRAAAEAGVEIREGYPVSDLLWDGDRVTGIQGPSGTERGRIVVGADGFRSMVAARVDASVYADLPPRTCGYYSHWADAPADALDFYTVPGRLGLSFPTDDGLTCVWICWPSEQFQAVRTNVEAEFMAGVDLWPSLARLVRGGRRVEPFRGTADLPMFLRKPWGNGWALVGDAGCRVDPITGQGITDAFRDAQFLSDALTAGLGGRVAIDSALANYQRRRDEAVMPIYQFTAERARLAPPAPDMQRLLTAIRGNQHEMNRFIGLTAGTTSIRDYFAPDNLARIVTTAAIAA
jgi:flavin-dependent dehydrogenase